MNKATLKALQDIVSDARACSQPQIPEELAKSTLASVARRIEELLADASEGRCVKAINDTLKPCPFCGGEALVTFDDESERPNIKYSAECINCGASTRLYDTEENAVEEWNRRINETDKIETEG